MRKLGITLIGLLLIAGCGDNQTGPDLIKQPGGGHVASSSLLGTVTGLTAYPDSTAVPLAGATVAAYFVGELPPDTAGTPPPPVPGDTMLTIRLAAFGRTGVATPMDTVVPPPDTAPPPPWVCDPSGTPVAVATTDGSASFRIDGLDPGIYELRVTPPAGSGFREITQCGVQLTDGQARSWDFYLPPGP